MSIGRIVFCCIFQPGFGEARGLGQQVIAFGNAGGLLRGGAVVRDSGGGIAGQFVQVGANGVEAVMIGDARIVVERVEQIQTVSGAVDHGGRDCVVEQDHGIVRHAPEEIVEGEDLRPVSVFGAGRFVVHSGDGGLQCVTADGTFLQRAGEQRGAFLDGGLVPERAVLLVERDDFAGGSGARGAAGIGEQHEGEQAGDLGVFGKQRVGGAGEADGFARRDRARCSSGPALEV